MVIKVFEEKKDLGRAAAEQAAASIRNAIHESGRARIIAATGAAQFEFLEALTKTADIDWRRVEMFHLDEYIGLPKSHPASFRRFLEERLIQKTGMTNYHLLDGDNDPSASVRSTSKAIMAAPIDIAFVGSIKQRTPVERGYNRFGFKRSGSKRRCVAAARRNGIEILPARAFPCKGNVIAAKPVELGVTR